MRKVKIKYLTYNDNYLEEYHSSLESAKMSLRSLKRTNFARIYETFYEYSEGPTVASYFIKNGRLYK